MDLTLIILISIIVAFIVFRFIIKPYTEKYDNTICYTGELGAGKTLNAVKKAKFLWKRNLRSIKWQNWKARQLNKIIKKHNKKALAYNNKVKENPKKKFKKLWTLRETQELPRLFSNIPIVVKKRKGNVEYCNILTKNMIKLIVKANDTESAPIPQYSVILIDELPQMINQFNWDMSDVQTNVNEFMTFFRHYIGGYLVITAQARTEVVKQMRTKFSRYYWLSDFQKFLFIFYRVRILALSDIDENTMNIITDLDSQARWKYGLLKPKIYDSRCFSERYPRDIKGKYKRFGKMKTNRIITFNKGTSPLGNTNNE